MKIRQCLLNRSRLNSQSRMGLLLNRSRLNSQRCIRPRKRGLFQLWLCIKQLYNTTKTIRMLPKLKYWTVNKHNGKILCVIRKKYGLKNGKNHDQSWLSQDNDTYRDQGGARGFSVIVLLAKWVFCYLLFWQYVWC